MPKATLYRIRSRDDGTFGVLVTKGGFGCVTVELPWRKNKGWVSCIPAGEYEFKLVNSPKHGECYEAVKVPGGRSHIQIHSANWAGDKAKGFKSQLHGCIAPGREIRKITGQYGVTNSSVTTVALEQALGKKPFELTIKWADGLNPEEAS